jgi:hypothetical protein
MVRQDRLQEVKILINIGFMTQNWHLSSPEENNERLMPLTKIKKGIVFSHKTLIFLLHFTQSIPEKFKASWRLNSNFGGNRSKQKKRYKGVLVVHVSAGESEVEDSLKSIFSQEKVKLKLVRVVSLTSQKSHKAVSVEYRNAPKGFLLLKIDGDMVLLDNLILYDILEFFNQSHDYTSQHIAIRDCFSGQWMQGVNVYTPEVDFSTMGNDPLRTDRLRLELKDRYFTFEWADRILHAPNPHKNQAIHFGAHRAAKVLASNGSDLPNLRYLKGTLERASSTNRQASVAAIMGASSWLATGSHDPEILDYDTPKFNSFLQGVLSKELTVKGDGERKNLKEFVDLRYPIMTDGATLRGNRYSWAILLPHLLHFGGIQRFLYFARELVAIGDHVEILVMDPSRREDSIMRSFSDLEHIIKPLESGIANVSVRDFVVTGDSSTDIIERARLVRGRRFISFILGSGGEIIRKHIFYQLRTPSDLVISVSELSQKQFPLPSLKIPGAVGSEFFWSKSNDRGSASSFRLVIQWGRGKPGKGALVALEFAEHAKSLHPNLEVHLVSATPVQAKLPNYVTEHLALDRSQLAMLLAESDALASFEEQPGWSNQQAEMAASGGIVFGNGKGAEDFIRTYCHAHLMNPGEDMETYVKRISQYLSQSTNKRLDASRERGSGGMHLFSWARWTSEVRFACSELLAFEDGGISALRTQKALEYLSPLPKLSQNE